MYEARNEQFRHQLESDLWTWLLCIRAYYILESTNCQWRKLKHWAARRRPHKYGVTWRSGLGCWSELFNPTSMIELPSWFKRITKNITQLLLSQSFIADEGVQGCLLEEHVVQDKATFVQILKCRPLVRPNPAQKELTNDIHSGSEEPKSIISTGPPYKLRYLMSLPAQVRAQSQDYWS